MLGIKKERLLHKNIGLKFKIDEITYLKIFQKDGKPGKGEAMTTDSKWIGMPAYLISISPVPG